MVYCVVSLKDMMPNVIDNITQYESVNSYKIGYLKCVLTCFPHRIEMTASGFSILLTRA